MYYYFKNKEGKFLNYLTTDLFYYSMIDWIAIIQITNFYVSRVNRFLIFVFLGLVTYSWKCSLYAHLPKMMAPCILLIFFQYLEVRFSKTIRTMGCIVFQVQMVRIPFKWGVPPPPSSQHRNSKFNENRYLWKKVYKNKYIE